jgi:ribosomal protein L23
MILRKPVVTEKSINEYKANKFVAFEVDVNANKISARKEFEDAYGMKVVDVKTTSRMGKYKRDRVSGRAIKLKDRKIMYFKIGANDKFDLLEK